MQKIAVYLLAALLLLPGSSAAVETVAGGVGSEAVMLDNSEIDTDIPLCC
ncbi:hypothetical protein OHA98_39195 [Streptomyces sp. NBC_00654]|nr:hypothetical protein [Streptomyces sp. NBC_00654]MCX4970679.1 hypothetical protein [Streptomyces sp. NBC_00654]